MIRTDGKPTIANARPLRLIEPREPRKSFEPYSSQYRTVSTRERELEREVARLKRELERVR